VVVVDADLLVAADGIRSAVLGKLVYEKEEEEEEEEEEQQQQQQKALKLSPEEECTKHICDTNKLPTNIGLRRMGVRLILGIADFEHPHLNERGFYTLDGTHRLFTMPYQSNRSFPSVDNNHSNNNNNKSSNSSRIMWQLSFATPTDFDESLDKTQLQNYVLETCHSWHPPVLDMIQATPLDTIWGT
jgi:hypothetical protein